MGGLHVGQMDVDVNQKRVSDKQDKERGTCIKKGKKDTSHPVGKSSRVGYSKSAHGVNEDGKAKKRIVGYERTHNTGIFLQSSTEIRDFPFPVTTTTLPFSCLFFQKSAHNSDQ